jgi:acyl carrier protein
MTDYFVAILQRLADNPARRLSDLSLNVEAERNQLKLNWNVPKKEDLKDTSFPQLSEVPLERMAETRANVSKDQHVPIVSAKTHLKGKIVQIWRDALALDKVGLNDNFFEVGGHSLLMLEIRNKIDELLGKKISVLDLFRYPTIGSLANYLTRKHHG